jgi:hypothetical protein
MIAEKGSHGHLKGGIYELCEWVKEDLELTLRIHHVCQPAGIIGERDAIPTLNDERPIRAPFACQAHIHHTSIEGSPGLHAMVGSCSDRHLLISSDAIDFLNEIHRVVQQKL